MNIESLVSWANNLCDFLNKSDEETNRQFDSDKVKEKLGWIKEYENNINEWSNIMNIILCFEDFVRKNGFYLNAQLELEKKLAQLCLGDREHLVINSLIHFVKNESLKAKPDERLLGSSEIIESLFGKQKQIEKQQVKSGFTGLLLTVAALVSDTTQEIVQKAMTVTKTKTIYEWYKSNIGSSV